MCSLITVEGPLLSISHVFYLANDAKMFFLHLQDADHKIRKIILSLSNLPPKTKTQAKGLLCCPLIGRILRVTNLRKVVLHGQEVLQVL